MNNKMATATRPQLHAPPPSSLSTTAAIKHRYRSTALALFNNGVFRPLPIKPKTKRPSVKSWSEVDITSSQVREWDRQFPNHGIGHQCGEVGALDIDILNEELADSIHRFFVNEFCDGRDYPTRYGQRPKRLIPVRLDGISRKMTSAKYEDPIGNIHGIELLAPGQQFIIFGQHPGTGAEYEWEQGDPLQLGMFDLPALTAGDFDYICDTFDEECDEKRGWRKMDENGAGHPRERTESQCEATLQEAISALWATNPNCSRPEWINRGTALKALAGEAGRYQFLEWSKRSDNPNHNDSDEELNKQWDSFDTIKGANPETLFYHANQTGWRYRQSRVDLSTPQEDFQDVVEDAPQVDVDNLDSRLVYVQDGNMVADLTKEPQNALLKIQEFHNSFKNFPMIEREGKPPLLASNSWLRSQSRKTVRGVKYLPNGLRIFTDQDELWFNNFHTPKWPRPASFDKIHVLEQHLELLVPEQVERDILIQWLGCTVHQPEIRPGFTPVHISHQHGLGRGWVIKVLQGVIGVWNCSHTKMKTLADGQFQDYLHETLLCSIPEIKVDRGKYAVDDQIRDRLTDSPLNLNLKYGGNGTYQIFTNFFMVTNNRDALVLTKEDRRMFVLETFADPPPEKYFRDTLYPVADDPDFLAQVYWWLAGQRDPSFNPFMRAPMTRAKASMVESSQGDMDDLFDEMVRDTTVQDVICYNSFVRYLKDSGYSWDYDDDRKERGIATAILQGKALKVANGKKVRVSSVDRNDKRRLYAIRNYEKWHNVTNEILLEEYRLVAKQ